MQEGRGASVTRAPAPDRTLLLATVAVAVAYDQVSKALAAHLLADGRPMRILGTLLDLQLTRNPGGAFGLFPNSPVLFLALTAVIVGAVLVVGMRSGQAPIPLGLVAGGGLGNLIDRVVRAPGHLQGRVVDFIHFRYWPTFNLADSSIVVGVGLLLLFELRRSRA